MGGLVSGAAVSQLLSHCDTLLQVIIRRRTLLFLDFNLLDLFHSFRCYLPCSYPNLFPFSFMYYLIYLATASQVLLR